MLRVNLRNGRFPHAFLFVGPEGVGKRTFARTLAQALALRAKPRGTAGPLRRVPRLRAGRGRDPPRPAGSRLGPRKSQSCRSRSFATCAPDFGLKPARGVRKVAIVDDVDDMNDEAANAFLEDAGRAAARAPC